MKVSFTIKGVISTPFAFYNNVQRLTFDKNKLIIECLGNFYRIYKLNRIYDLVIENDD